MAVPPAALISATTAAQLSALRLEITTRAPCSASCMAIALPIPRLEPVTRATLPDRSNSVMCQLRVLNDCAFCRGRRGEGTSAYLTAAARIEDPKQIGRP